MSKASTNAYNKLTQEAALALPPEEVLEALRNDELYYGKFGQNWYSNSHLSRMLKDPLLLDEQDWGNGSALVIGSFMHTYILEPHKVDDFLVIDVDNRNKKEYKEALQKHGEKWLLTNKDRDKYAALCEKALASPDVRKMLKEDNVEYEVPLIGYLNGIPVKGKADAINHDLKLIIDVKTTSNADGLNEPTHYDPEALTKARSFNYDAQAWLYSYLYPGYGFRFVAIDKRTEEVQIYDASVPFLLSGKKKIFEAIDNLKRYWIKTNTTPYKLLK